MPTRSCTNCHASFTITDQDLAFYTKLSPQIAGQKIPLPSPTHCPDCRQQRRLARRNELKFYHRKCDLTDKQIIAIYSADKPWKVYSQAAWWSDKWDPMQYGRPYDPSRPFFDQFHDLMLQVPRAAVFGKNNENSDYTNHTEGCKNCYICVDTVGEDIYFSKWMMSCKDCCDSFQMEKSERCYECQYGANLQNCIYAYFCKGSSNIAFCYDLEDCHDCIFSSHLRHKRFYWANEQLTEEEYRRRLSALNFGSYKIFSECLAQFRNMLFQTFRRAKTILSSEDSTGDFLDHCKNIRNSFSSMEAQDCAYLYECGWIKDSMDVYESAFNIELDYECHACNRTKFCIGCSISYDIDNCLYCDTCHNSSFLFGCVGLRHKQYCILNTQYTKEEYEKLVPQIIEQMRLNNTWGEFFPIAHSPFGYNETVAMDYFPLTETSAHTKQYSWYDESEKGSYLGESPEIPDDITTVSDQFSGTILRCEKTQKPFKIIPQELTFYKKMGIPLPHLSPDIRYKERMSFTNPRKLWYNKCSGCGIEIETTFSPDRPETIYCEKCYLEAIY